MPSKTQSILLSGGVIGIVLVVVQFIPWVGACLCVLAILGAGLLAVWHYTDTYQLTVAGGTGAGMGALAAVAAGIVDGVIGLIFQALGLVPSAEEAAQAFLEGMQQAGSGEQAEAVRQLVESPLFLIAVFGIQLLIFAVLGAIGGAIGASLFKKEGEEDPVQPPRPSQEPPSDPSRGDETSWRTE